ncbi:MAG: hypothetical protein JST30_12195 [Armatimonadetes bacterium]|nr:hypothetical protein [Armatimonadota bacterium]
MDEREPPAAIELVKSALKEYPEVQGEEVQGTFSVTAGPGGFNVSIQESNGEQIVSAGFWHDHFDDAIAASDCFLWLLTPLTRVVEKRKRGRTVGARLERLENDEWVPMGSTSNLFQSPFAKAEDVVLQNRHIERDPPDQVRGPGQP